MGKFATIVAAVQEQSGFWFSKASIVAILFFLFFVAGGGISQNERWRISHVDISGANTVPVDIIRALARQKLTGNYFFVYARENSRLFPSKEIEQVLLDVFPQFENVSVGRIDNNTIRIVIKERVPYALWCGDSFVSSVKELSKCWFIDAKGFVFDRAPIFSDGVYMEVYGKLIEKNIDEPLRGELLYNRFAIVDNFVKLIHKDIGKSYRVLIKPEGELEVVIHSSIKYPFLNNVAVRFKDESNPEVLVKNMLSAILVQFPNNIESKKKLLYIDMRFGNKIFFGFEN